MNSKFFATSKGAPQTGVSNHDKSIFMTEASQSYMQQKSPKLRINVQANDQSPMSLTRRPAFNLAL